MRKFLTTCVLMIVLAAAATACSDGGSGGGFRGGRFGDGGGSGGGGGKPSVEEIRSALDAYNVPEQYADCVANGVHDKLSGEEISSLRGGNDDTFSDLPSDLQGELQDIATDCISSDSGDVDTSGGVDTGESGRGSSGGSGAGVGTATKPSRADFSQELRDSGASSSEAACYTDELYDDVTAADIDDLRALLDGEASLSDLPTSVRRKVLQAEQACESATS